MILAKITRLIARSMRNIAEISEGKHSNVGTALFAAGFTVMMALDVALG